MIHCQHTDIAEVRLHTHTHTHHQPHQQQQQQQDWNAGSYSKKSNRHQHRNKSDSASQHSKDSSYSQSNQSRKRRRASSHKNFHSSDAASQDEQQHHRHHTNGSSVRTRSMSRERQSNRSSYNSNDYNSNNQQQPQFSRSNYQNQNRRSSAHNRPQHSHSSSASSSVPTLHPASNIQSDSYPTTQPDMFDNRPQSAGSTRRRSAGGGQQNRGRGNRGRGRGNRGRGRAGLGLLTEQALNDRDGAQATDPINRSYASTPVQGASFPPSPSSITLDPHFDERTDNNAPSLPPASSTPASGVQSLWQSIQTVQSPSSQTRHRTRNFNPNIQPYNDQHTSNNSNSTGNRRRGRGGSSARSRVQNNRESYNNAAIAETGPPSNNASVFTAVQPASGPDGMQVEQFQPSSASAFTSAFDAQSQHAEQHTASSAYNEQPSSNAAAGNATQGSSHKHKRRKRRSNPKPPPDALNLSDEVVEVRDKSPPYNSNLFMMTRRSKPPPSPVWSGGGLDEENNDELPRSRGGRMPILADPVLSKRDIEELLSAQTKDMDLPLLPEQTLF